MQQEIQQASFTPKCIGFNATVPPRKRKAWYALPLSELQLERQTLRTVMFDDAGMLAGAKIDLSNGEITPHDYKDFFPKRAVIRAKAEPPDIDPSWVRIPASSTPKALLTDIPIEQKKRRGRRPKVVTNRLKCHLQGFDTVQQAFDTLQGLDNIVSGAAQLDREGNTRDLNKYALVSMLRKIDIISTQAVEALMQCDDRHARKVASAMRIINTEALKLSALWPAPEERNHFDAI